MSLHHNSNLADEGHSHDGATRRRAVINQLGINCQSRRLVM